MPHSAAGSHHPNFYARYDFFRAHRRAELEWYLHRLTGRQEHLASFDEACQALGPYTAGPRQLKEIPLAMVVGSVGRPHDFTARFLPLNLQDEEKWVAVEQAIDGDPVNLPPIEVYQLDEKFYVINGHNRAAVLRWLGIARISAYVSVIQRRSEAAGGGTA